MKSILSALLVLTALATSCGQSPSEKRVGGACDGCEAMMEGMPASIEWETNIAPPGEPGEKLVLSGTIYKSDGKTPAPGVILYVYHTDNKGEYSPAPNQRFARRHGHLRGWVKSDANGKYRFTTIRPASYPTGRNPQHIHPLVKEEGKSLYWIDEYLFDDDPFLTAEERSRQEKRGGAGVIHLTKDDGGSWTGKRDIILGLNIPGY